MMSKYRSILALALAFVFTLLITGTDSAAAATKSRAKAPTYSAVQTEQIQGYTNEVGALRDRLTELQDLIQNEKWTFARNFIHGPLGELRAKMISAAKVLAPEPQKQAREASKEVFTALVGIDQAGADRNYGLLLKGLDTFFQALPVSPQPPAPAAFTVPEIKAPKIKAPEIEMPKIEMPKIEMPKIEMPKIEMPKIEMPKIEMPKAAAPSDAEMAAPESSEMMAP
jgi:photosystem II protein PsbQ